MAGAALLPWSVCKVSAASVLTKVPAVAAVTSTVTVQVPAVAPLPAGIDRVVGNVSVEPPAVAPTTPVPLQVVLVFGVAAIVTPRGNVSVRGALKVATLVFRLDRVMVRVETLPAPALMVAGLKA